MMPLYDGLLSLSKTGQTEFFMPGHKRGAALDKAVDVFAMDVTELPQTDNLHAPEGMIAEAQALAAQAFGAKKTYFCTNGSSGGVLAAISALCREGDKILVDRNCHLSVIRALILTGAQPVWMVPPYKPEQGYTDCLTAEDVAGAILKNPDAVAVFITSPTYYGRTADIAAIAEAVHLTGKRLIVDEAHGSHLGFSPLLPPSAVHSGADIVIHSAHKTLPALTQSAYVHVNCDLPQLDEWMRMYQSTSPSYLLMAYLDYARAYMQYKGEVALFSLITRIRELFPEQEQPGKDITRLVFHFTDATGFAAAELMRSRYHVEPEMADIANVVCIATVADTREDLVRLQEAVHAAGRLQKRPPHLLVSYPCGIESVMSPREAFYRPYETIPLAKCENRIARTTVALYPPGVPEVVPGERLTKKHMQNILSVLMAGGSVTGLEGEKIPVLCEERMYQ